MAKYRIVIITYALFMIVGNTLRMIPMPREQVWAGALNLSEIILYGICGLILVLSLRELRNLPREFIYIYGLFLISFIIGSVKAGQLSLNPLSHNVRIAFYFLTSFAIGLSFFKVYAGNLNGVLKLYLSLIFIYTIGAWILFYLFPNTLDLWGFLSELGAIYHGVEWKNRLMGTMFDPNFFGNILILYILIALFLFREKRRAVYLGLGLYLIIVCFFTLSRSSVFGLIIAAVIFYARDINDFLKNLYKDKRHLIRAGAWIVILAAVAIIFRPVIERFISRFADFSQDSSTVIRLENISLGLNLLERPGVIFFGIGYNFFNYLGLTGLSSIDSSLLALMVTLGIPIFTVVAIQVYRFVVKSCPAPGYHGLFYRRVIITYGVVSLIICNLNNLLTYPFWVFAFLPLMCYLYLLNRAGIENETGN